MPSFKNVSSKIRNIIVQHDPIGLIAGGAPDDEYDDLIIKLVKALNRIFENSAREKIIRETVDSYWSINDQAYPEEKKNIVSEICKEWPKGFVIDDGE